MLAAMWIAWQGGAARAEEFLRVGSVRDGCTAAAIEGVVVELWTENEFGPPELVGSARTDRDGRYALSDHERTGAKLRLRHGQYRTLVEGSSEEEFVLFPRGEPAVFEFRDLEGAPLAGVRVLTTRTCRHAIPSIDATSDASGRVVIPDWPALNQEGDIALIAPGYGALGQLGIGELEAMGTVYLPRRAPVTLRLLDSDGSPLRPGACRYEADTGGYPLVPDAAGRVTIDPLFMSRAGGVQLHAFAHELPPPHELFELRCGDAVPGPDEAWLQVFLEVPIEEEKTIPLLVYDEHGYVWSQVNKGCALMAGKLRVVLGRRFSGVRETIVPLELGRGERRSLDLPVEREPTLELTLPGGPGLLSVQAGDDSISAWAEHGLRTGVPPGVPVTVLFQGRGERRAHLAPWSGTLTLDLAAAGHVLVPAPAEARAFEATYRVRSNTGQPLTVTAELTAHDHEPADLDPALELVRVAIPAGRRFEVRLSAEGHVALYRTGVAVAGGTSFEDVTLPVESE
jgi:hypothetical protein